VSGPREIRSWKAYRSSGRRFAPAAHTKGILMNRLIYIIGAVVVVIALLSFFGLR